MTFSIVDLRVCPALAGPDEVVELLQEYDHLRTLADRYADAMVALRRFAADPDSTIADLRACL